jgi:hypothetical protein
MHVAAPSDLFNVPQAAMDFDFKTDKGFSFCLTPRSDGRECDKCYTLSTTKIGRCGDFNAAIFQVTVVAHAGIYNLNTISRG